MICSRFISSTGWESHGGRDDVCLAILQRWCLAQCLACGGCLVNVCWINELCSFFAPTMALDHCAPVWLQFCIILTLQNLLMLYSSSLQWRVPVTLDGLLILVYLPDSAFFGDWGSVSNHHPSSSSNNNNNNNTRNNSSNEHLLFARLSSEALTCIASFNPYAKCLCVHCGDPLYLRENSSSENLHGLLRFSSLQLRFCCMQSKENLLS